jgi:hypothetical protein
VNVGEADPKKHGLKKGDVARKCIRAVEEKTAFIPGMVRAAMWMYWLVPCVVG